MQSLAGRFEAYRSRGRSLRTSNRFDSGRWHNGAAFRTFLAGLVGAEVEAAFLTMPGRVAMADSFDRPFCGRDSQEGQDQPAWNNKRAGKWNRGVNGADWISKVGALESQNIKKLFARRRIINWKRRFSARQQSKKSLQIARVVFECCKLVPGVIKAAIGRYVMIVGNVKAETPMHDVEYDPVFIFFTDSILIIHASEKNGTPDGCHGPGTQNNKRRCAYARQKSEFPMSADNGQQQCNNGESADRPYPRKVISNMKFHPHNIIILRGVVHEKRCPVVNWPSPNLCEVKKSLPTQTSARLFSPLRVA
jgi:hypothetical protein